MAGERQREQLVDEILDEALAGYEGLVSAEQLAEIRNQLADTLMVQPDGRRLVRQCMSDPQVQRSGDLAHEDETDSERRVAAGVNKRSG